MTVRLGRLLLLCVAAATLSLAMFQVVLGRRQSEIAGFFSAVSSHGTIYIYAVVVAILASLAAALPRRFLLAVPLTTVVAAAAIACTAAVYSNQAWSILVGLATLGTAWLIGSTVLGLRACRRFEFSRLPAVSTAFGYTTMAVVVFCIGAVGAIRWWNVGLAVLAGGIVSSVIFVRRNWGSDHLAVSGSRLRSFCLSIIGLTASYGAIWAAAPDIQYDAVYGHVWQASAWAFDGRIGFSLTHPTANMFGSSYIVSVPAALLGAHDAGRWVQYFLALALAVMIWRLCDTGKSLYAPLAAVVFIITPHVLWQMSTANDDLALVLLVLGLAVAMLRADIPAQAAAIAPSIVIGFLAGGALGGKLHLAPFAISAALMWSLFGPGGKRIGRFVGTACGALVAAGPVMIGRWIATGNPLFPQFNNIFKSPYYPPVNERLNLPFLKDGSLGALLRVPVIVASAPDRLMEAVPPGVVPLVAGPLAALLMRDRRLMLAALPMLVAIYGWWTQLRYLRYLLPYTVVGFVLLAAVAAPALISMRARYRPFVGFMLVALVVATFPSTLSAFWNIHERLPLRVALGLEPRLDYESRSLPASSVIRAFNKLGSPGDMLVGPDAYVRSDLRNGLDSSLDWEFAARESFKYPTTSTQSAEILRRWTTLGADFLEVNAGARAKDAISSEMKLLIAHQADLSWAGHGLELYHLTSGPVQPIPLPWCDASFQGSQACWSGSLDSTAGLTSQEASDAGSGRTISVCTGGTYIFAAVTEGGSGSTDAFLAARSKDGALLDYEPVTFPAGTSGSVALTALPGMDHFDFTLKPIGDAVVSAATVSVIGAPATCSS
jgi:hypothetical protein